MLALVAAPKAPTFSSCSQAQQGPITSALAQAVNMASSAKTALDGAPSWARYTARRYSEWFGAYDAGRYATVSAHYAKILDALSNQAMKFNCDCSDNSYAYVYPTKPYEVFLCKLFWTAPLTGTDSKAGTIVHETSHFNVVAGDAGSCLRPGGMQGAGEEQSGQRDRERRHARVFRREHAAADHGCASGCRSSRSPTSGVICRPGSEGDSTPR